MTTLAAGDPAPDFSLKDDAGNVIDSASMRGRRHVLYFYPADDTAGCTKEACQFNDDLAGFDGAGVPVIGVSRDDARSHQRFRAKYGLRFPLATDPDGSVHAAFGAWGERPGRGVGVIRSTFLIGADGRIERAWYGVKADGHAKQVLEALAA